MATTWNPLDKSAGITLSGGNNTATAAAGGGVRSTSSHNIGGGGKYYFEFTSNTLASSNDGLGLANASWVLSATSNSNNIISHVNFGSIRDGNGGSASLSDGSPQGHTLSVAVDFVNNKTWWRIDGNGWNNAVIGSQDPANNIGGILMQAPAFPAATPMFIAAALVTTSDATTLNSFGSFLQSVPAGFIAWDSVPPFARSQGTVMS